MTSSPGAGGPVVSLRTLVLIVVALAVAIGAGALAYWHMPWVIVGGVAFAGTLTFLNNHVK
jgi:uncharacterized membrane protein YgdD (TMEM256/DUF423 family)